jgi:hypothetical protein
MKTKIMVVTVAVASLVAALAWEGAAANSSKSPKRNTKRHYPRHAAQVHAYKSKNPDARSWYPHDAKQLPFGSAIWWEQMLRENRLTGDTM